MLQNLTESIITSLYFQTGTLKQEKIYLLVNFFPFFYEGPHIFFLLIIHCSLKDQLTIGSYVSIHSSRYEARGKFGEHKRCIRVVRGVVKRNSSFLSALQTSQVLHISINAQLTYEPIVL